MPGLQGRGCSPRRFHARLALAILATWALGAGARGASNVTVSVDINTTFQTMEGWGASSMYTEDRLTEMREPYRSEVYDLLFKDLGANVLYIRLYPDAQPTVDGRFYWGHMRHQRTIIDEALERGNINRILAYVSGPPGWMKDNHDVDHGGHVRPEYYDDFARFCRMFVTGMRNDYQRDIYSWCIFNEPGLAANYDSTSTTATEYRDILKVVGADFATNGLGDVKQAVAENANIVSAIGAKGGNFIQTIMTDTVAASYVDAFTVHSFADKIGTDDWPWMAVQGSTYHKPIWQTSAAKLEKHAASIVDASWGSWQAHRSINLGNSTTWCWWHYYWPTGEPDPVVGDLVSNNEDQGIIEITSATKYLVVPRYYMFKHWSKNVHPGAVRVNTTSSAAQLNVSAFREGNTVVIQATNYLHGTHTQATTATLTCAPISGAIQHIRTSETENYVTQPPITPHGNSFVAYFPPNSINTFIVTTGLNTPAPKFSASATSGVAPLTVSFTDKTTGAPTGWAWDFQNDGVTDSTLQNPSFQFTSAGTYNVRLTASNAQGSATTPSPYNIVVTNGSPPGADFIAYPLAGTPPLTVHFTDTSTTSPTAWEWDFDNDGTTDSTAQNPDYTFDDIGDFTVKLRATNASGSALQRKPHYIAVTQDGPTSNGLTIVNGYGEIPGEDWDHFVWDPVTAFSAGAPKGVPLPGGEIVTDPTDPGNHVVQLTNGYDGGAITHGLTGARVRVDGFPTGVFPVKEMGKLTFRVYVPAGLPLSHAFAFCDLDDNELGRYGGGDAHEALFSFHNQLEPGKWNAVIIDTSQTTSTFSGNADGHGSLMFEFGVPPKIDYAGATLYMDDLAFEKGTGGCPPVAEFSGTPLTGPVPLTVNFTDQSLHVPTSWMWDFDGDQTIDSTSQNPQFEYDTPGTYTVTLTAANSNGSKSRTRTNYIVATPPPPTAKFHATVVVGLAPLDVHFTDDSEDSPTSWAWDFKNDGTAVSTNQNTGYTYPDDGLYTVKLRATNAYGFDDEIKTQYIAVWDPLAQDTFEAGFGSYTDGGADCALAPGYGAQGSVAANIRAGSGTASSFYTTTPIDVRTPNYTQIAVAFWMQSAGMESGKSFLVQYYDGTQWLTVATLVSGTDFANGVSAFKTIAIPRSTYDFPTNMRIRFQCNASDTSDNVYIDQVTVAARDDS